MGLSTLNAPALLHHVPHCQHLVFDAAVEHSREAGLSWVEHVDNVERLHWQVQADVSGEVEERQADHASSNSSSVAGGGRGFVGGENGTDVDCRDGFRGIVKGTVGAVGE